MIPFGDGDPADDLTPVPTIRRQLVGLYDEAAKDARRIAKAQHKALLTGAKYKRRTDQGLDAWSEAAGRASAFGDLVALVAPEVERPDFDPVAVRRECEEQARAEFAEALTAEMTPTDESTPGGGS